jgi:hypothetical protein
MPKGKAAAPKSDAPPLPKLEDADKNRPPPAEIFRTLCGLYKHQAHHESKVQDTMA